MKTSRRGLLVDVSIAVLAGLLAVAVYVRSLAPGLLWGDSAEFQFAAWLGGFAHPTGYPLYLMLGWLWTHLVPLRDPAFRMNLFSAIWGGLAVVLLCLLVMRLIRFLADASERGVAAASRLIAFGAALAFILTPTFWSQAIIAEVYTLHAVFMTALLLALAVWAEGVTAGDTRRARRLSYTVALLFGFSLTHHRSTILLIPATAAFVVIVLAANRWRPRLSFRRSFLLLACLLAPLLLYLYIPLRAPQVPYYRLPLTAGASLPLYDDTIGGLLAHVSGSVFSSALAAPRAGALNVGDLAGRFVNEFSINGLFLGVVGVGFLIFLGFRDRGWRAWSVLALTGVFFVAQVAFNLFYAIGDIQVFYIPAYLVWVLWMALGAWALVCAVAWLFASQGERVRRWALTGAAALALVVLLAFAYRSAAEFWPKVQRASDDSATRAWTALLESGLPRDAVLVSNDRDEMVPLWYLRYVDGQRSDLSGLFPLIQPGPEWSNVGAVVDAALRTGRPVYLVKPMPGLEIKYELTPAQGPSAGLLGPAVRVASLRSPSPAHSTDAVYGAAVRLLGYDISPDPLVPGQSAEVTLYWETLAGTHDDWSTFVQVLDANGEKAGQSDHQLGGVFYPSSMWATGEHLKDKHDFRVTPDATPGPRQLIVGLYVPSGDGLRQLGAPQTVGEVTVSQ